MLEGPFRLRRSGDVDGVVQLAVHLVHLGVGWCGQSVHERGRHGHILAGPDKGRVLVDISYAAPQAHKIVNEALHREYSLGIVFV
jgi:hypothetical protein